jgi:hypothetical protein
MVKSEGSSTSTKGEKEVVAGVVSGGVTGAGWASKHSADLSARARKMMLQRSPTNDTNRRRPASDGMRSVRSLKGDENFHTQPHIPEIRSWALISMSFFATS